MGEEGLSSEEFLPLPLLKELNIESCDRLLEIPQLPPSLETLRIDECQRLVALPSNLRNLAKLRDVTVWNCSSLKALPDGMGGLTSLEELMIGGCPRIEEFPQGLLQRLPSLKYLEIWGCPGLLRLCREGGEYFDLVSSIPKTDIEVAEELNQKQRKLERFLPFCSGDSPLR